MLTISVWHPCTKN